MRRLILAMLATLALTGTAMAQDAKATPKASRQGLDVIAAASPITMSALFEVAGDAIVSHGMTFIPATTNVLVAKKNDDGTIATACVVSERQMRSFLERNHRDEAARPSEK